ncbi:hypothetical protein Fmac_000537 [Flemingia macrophylla]|uniref:Uncharacterized protein n=1 Tax=Flemingia macrophylla TaxID=520843 RepID=A0ABD1NEJ4_9FABA
MGICISSESSVIHEEACDENLIVFETNKVLRETRGLCSAYSKQGSKGLNQDAATLCQGYGEEKAAFCGIFDMAWNDWSRSEQNSKQSFVFTHTEPKERA